MYILCMLFLETDTQSVLVLSLLLKQDKSVTNLLGDVNQCDPSQEGLLMGDRILEKSAEGHEW